MTGESEALGNEPVAVLMCTPKIPHWIAAGTHGEPWPGQ